MNKSFTDKLRERREFVESTNQLGGAMQRYGRGGGTPGPVQAPPDLSTIMQGMVQGNPAMSQYLQQRNAYNTDSQNQLGSQVASQINNGVDGSAVNPVAALGVLKDLYTNNQNASNSLFQMLSQGAQQSAANSIDAQKATNDYSLGQGELANKGAQTQSDLLKSGQSIGPDGKVQWGSGDGSNTNNKGIPLYGPQAEAAVDLMPGGKQILASMDPNTKTQAVAKILQLGSIGEFLKQNPKLMDKPTSDTLQSTQETLNKINYIQNQLSKSKSLQNALNLPDHNFVLDKNNKWLNQNYLKLSPEDMQALAYMTNLNATNDQKAVGGRLDNYLLQSIGPSSVGKGQTSQTNLKMLEQAKKNILDNLRFTAGQTGFNNAYDLPNMNFGKVQMKAPSGKIFEFDTSDPRQKAEASQALQSGYQEL